MPVTVVLPGNRTLQAWFRGGGVGGHRRARTGAASTLHRCACGPRTASILHRCACGPRAAGVALAVLATLAGGACANDARDRAAAVRRGQPPARFAAAQRLIAGGAGAGAAVDLLLADEDPLVRVQAVRIAAARHDDGAPRLAAALRDSDPRVRRAAASSLAKRPAVEATGPLVDALADSDAGVRVRALRALIVHVDTLAATALARVAALLGDTDVDARRWASVVLAQAGDAAAAVWPAALLAASPEARRRAAWALGRWAAAAPGRAHVAEPLLARALQDQAAAVRSEAAAALAVLREAAGR